MATPHYRSQYSNCPMCACEEFGPGFIDSRLKTAYWPRGRPDPDFRAMKQELHDQYGLVVTEDEIEEHWELHVAGQLEEYREWAHEKMEHSIAEDPYEAGMTYDE